jgi:hypothetical protein
MCLLRVRDFLLFEVEPEWGAILVLARKRTRGSSRQYLGFRSQIEPTAPIYARANIFWIIIFLFPNPLVLILFSYSSTSNCGHKAGVNTHVLIAPSSPVHRLLSANLRRKAGSRTGGRLNRQWRRLTRLRRCSSHRLGLWRQSAP